MQISLRYQLVGVKTRSGFRRISVQRPLDNTRRTVNGDIRIDQSQMPGTARAGVSPRIRSWAGDSREHYGQRCRERERQPIATKLAPAHQPNGCWRKPLLEFRVSSRPSQLTPRSERHHRAGHTGRLRVATLADMRRCRTRFGIRDRLVKLVPHRSTFARCS